MNAKLGNRNYCLDYIKGVACVCVIFMHCEFPGKLGILVQCISRFCVPFFFMVSGYFCYKEEGADYLRKIKHIGFITFGATIFYYIVSPLYRTAGPIITFVGILKWVLLNEPVYIAGQLWFLFALLYDYILFAIIEKLSIKRFAYNMIPVGCVLYILMAQIAHLLGLSIPNMIYRNFLIEGFTFFTLGFWIHENQDRIEIPNRLLILIFIISTVLCPVERLIMGRDFGVNIVSYPQVSSLFLLGINNAEFGKGKLLNKIGSKYSLYIYIIHPAVWHLLEKVYAIMHIDTNAVALYALPILCLLVTVALSITTLRAKILINNMFLQKKA